MTNPPSRQTIEGMAAPAGSGQARRPAATPVFKPEFARSLRMHPLVAAVVAAVVLVSLLAFAFSQKPVYEAESIVQIEPTSGKLLGDSNSGLFDSARYESFLAQQMQTAQRLDILSEAIKSLPAGTWQHPGESLDSAATRLQSAVKTQRVATSYQVSFTLRGADPVKTAATLNAVVAAYLKRGQDERMSLAEQRMQILVEERQRVTTDLDAARTEQARLSASLGMASAGMDVGNPYDSQLVGLRTELAAARESHDVAAAQLASVSGSDSTHSLGLSATAEEMIASDAGLSSMKSSISQRRATLSGQMAGLTPENPIYKQDQEEIADLDRTVDAASTQAREKAARRLQDKLRADLSRTGDVEARLNAQLAQQTYAATSASPKLQRATELTADITRLMGRYAEVDNALRGLQLENSGPGLAHQVLAATPPVTPAASRVKLIVLAAIPLALFLGAMAAVFARKRDKRVYTGLDMEDLLGFPPIAVLPSSDDVSVGVMQEYALRLAGGIESAFRNSGARTFVLTSAGVDHDIHELGVSLADRMRHLGLDCTTVEPAQVLDANLFADETGQTEALLARPAAGQHDGVAPRNIAHLKTLHDVVFVRTAPLLLSAETEYMVRCSDATILIVQSGKALRGELLQSATLLERLNVRGIAAVLDGLHLRVASDSFRRAVAKLERQRQDQPRSQRAAVVTPVQVEAQPVAFASPDMDYSEQAATDASEPQLSYVAPLAEVVHAPAFEKDDTPAFADEQPQTARVPMAEEWIEPAEWEAAPAPELSEQVAEHVDEPAAVAPAAVTEPEVSASVEPLPAATKEQPEVESGSWLERIFRQESSASVSILPALEADTSEVAQQESMAAAAPFKAAVPVTIQEIPVVAESVAEVASGPTVQAEEGSLPLAALPEEEVSQPLIPAPVSEPVSIAPDPLDVAEGVEADLVLEPAAIAVPEPLAAESIVAEPALEEPIDAEPIVAKPTIAEPPVNWLAIPPASAFQIQKQSPLRVHAERAAARGVDVWPAPMPINDRSSEPAAATPAASTPSLLQTFLHEAATAPLQKPTPPIAPPRAATKPLSPSRWEPIPPLRGETMPWRAPSGSRRAMHTRESRKPAEQAASKLPVAPETRPLQEVNRPAEGPEREAGLTRRWGLLSRFENYKAGSSPAQTAATAEERQDALAARAGISRRS